MDINELEDRLKQLDQAIANAENSAEAYLLILQKVQLEEIISRID